MDESDSNETRYRFWSEAERELGSLILRLADLADAGNDEEFAAACRTALDSMGMPIRTPLGIGRVRGGTRGHVQRYRVNVSSTERARRMRKRPWREKTKR